MRQRQYCIPNSKYTVREFDKVAGDKIVLVGLIQGFYLLKVILFFRKETIMKTSKKILVIVSMVALVVFLQFANGCKESNYTSRKSAAAFATSVELCTDCGQIKGSELCCKPDQPKCSSCGLVKGSPGCCNIPAGAETAAICTKCGQIKGTELCCKPGQTKCSSCGLVEGSPGCCKI